MFALAKIYMNEKYVLASAEVKQCLKNTWWFMIITEQFGQTNSNMYSRVRWSCRQSNIPMSLSMAEREDGIYIDIMGGEKYEKHRKGNDKKEKGQPRRASSVNPH